MSILLSSRSGDAYLVTDQETLLGHVKMSAQRITERYHKGVQFALRLSVFSDVGGGSGAFFLRGSTYDITGRLAWRI